MGRNCHLYSMGIKLVQLLYFLRSFNITFYVYVYLIFCFKPIYCFLIVVLCYILHQIQETLQRATFDSNSQVGIIFHVMDAVESPPTYFRTNSFTNAYQEIVDAYGQVMSHNYIVKSIFCFILGKQYIGLYMRLFFLVGVNDIQILFIAVLLNIRKPIRQFIL